MTKAAKRMRLPKTAIMSLKVGIYRFEALKSGQRVRLMVKNPGGRAIATKVGGTVREAATKIAETTTDEGLQKTIQSTVFPEF